MLVKGYKPQTINQEIICLYAKVGNLLTVVDYVSDSGYRLENGKYYSKFDISVIIRSNPKGDKLQMMVRKFLKKKDMSSRCI